MATTPPWMAVLDGEAPPGPPYVDELDCEPPFVGLYGSSGGWRKEVARAFTERSMRVYDPEGAPVRLSQLGIWSAECFIFHLYGQAVRPVDLIGFGYMLGLEKQVFFCVKNDLRDLMTLAQAHPGRTPEESHVVECASLTEATDRALAFMYEAEKRYKVW